MKTRQVAAAGLPAKTWSTPDMREKLSIKAVEPIIMSPEQFGQFIVTDIVRGSKLAKDRGIQIDS